MDSEAILAKGLACLAPLRLTSPSFRSANFLHDWMPAVQPTHDTP